jgi:hypothetical protein
VGVSLAVLAEREHLVGADDLGVAVHERAHVVGR